MDDAGALNRLLQLLVDLVLLSLRGLSSALRTSFGLELRHHLVDPLVNADLPSNVSVEGSTEE